MSPFICLLAFGSDLCGALKWGFAETEKALQNLVLNEIAARGFPDRETVSNLSPPSPCCCCCCGAASCCHWGCCYWCCCCYCRCCCCCCWGKLLLLLLLLRERSHPAAAAAAAAVSVFFRDNCMRCFAAKQHFIYRQSRRQVSCVSFCVPSHRARFSALILLP